MRTVSVLLVMCLCISMAGCSWMDGSYHSVTPHLPEKVDVKQETVTIDSVDVLPSALLRQVEQGSSSMVFYCRNGDENQLKYAMDQAVYTLARSNGIYAYAVDDIVYEVGQRNSQTVLSVQITYLHGKPELQKIRQAEDMDKVTEIIGETLDACEAGVVMRVAQFEEMDIAQFVQDYVNANPQTCMEMPQIAVTVYPDSGADRVVELTATYNTSREALRNMQEAVQPVFAAAKSYVDAEAEDEEKYSQLYAFLMGRDAYTVGTSLTPAYSLLSHGVGDSKAFAAVYAAMCRQSELECRIISGTREGEPWCWNVIKIDGVDYHLDLLQSVENGGFQIKQGSDMAAYVWDYSAYS